MWIGQWDPRRAEIKDEHGKSHRGDRVSSSRKEFCHSFLIAFPGRLIEITIASTATVGIIDLSATYRARVPLPWIDPQLSLRREVRWLTGQRFANQLITAGVSSVLLESMRGAVSSTRTCFPFSVTRTRSRNPDRFLDETHSIRQNYESCLWRREGIVNRKVNREHDNCTHSIHIMDLRLDVSHKKCDRTDYNRWVCCCALTWRVTKFGRPTTGSAIRSESTHSSLSGRVGISFNRLANHLVFSLASLGERDGPPERMYPSQFLRPLRETQDEVITHPGWRILITHFCGLSKSVTRLCIKETLRRGNQSDTSHNAM